MRKGLWMMKHNDITTRTKGQHLSLSERIEIQTQKRLGYSKRRIAINLKRSHSTINDEIKRRLAIQKKIVNGYTYYSENYYAETGQFFMRNIVGSVDHSQSWPKYKLSSVTLLKR